MDAIEHWDVNDIDIIIEVEKYFKCKSDVYKKLSKY